MPSQLGESSSLLDPIKLGELSSLLDPIKLDIMPAVTPSLPSALRHPRHQFSLP